MKKIIKIIVVTLAVVVGGLGAIMGLWVAFFIYSCGPRTFVGHDAIVNIRSQESIRINDDAHDAYYCAWGFQDRSAFMSFTLSSNEAAYWLLKTANDRNVGIPAAALASGNRSVDDGINKGPPRPRLRRWKDEYWNLTSITNGLMYERPHWFGCVDPVSGRIYISTSSR